MRPFHNLYWNWRCGTMDRYWPVKYLFKFRLWLGIKILGRLRTPREIGYMQRMVDAEHELGMFKEDLDRGVKYVRRTRRPDEGLLRGQDSSPTSP